MDLALLAEKSRILVLLKEPFIPRIDRASVFETF